MNNATEIATTSGRAGAAAFQPMQVLTMALAGDVFALDSDSVLEVLDLTEVTEVPNCRTFVKGLINVRGKVVPVVDLKVRLGIRAASETTADSRIVVMTIDLNGEETLVGVLADKVYEVIEIAPAALEEAPTIGVHWRAEFIKAIGKRADGFIVVIDIGKVFAAGEDGHGLAKAG
jgi:purine-binding chemotaxis protein CheW